MKHAIIIIILLVSLLVVIALQSLSKGSNNKYFTSYINTDIIGGYVD